MLDPRCPCLRYRDLPPDGTLEMDFMEKNDVTDKVVQWNGTGWSRRLELQRTLKQTYTHINDIGTLWRTSATGAAMHEVSCNAPVHIAKLSAVVTLGSPDGTTDKILSDRVVICRKETATWIKEYLYYPQAHTEWICKTP